MTIVKVPKRWGLSTDDENIGEVIGYVLNGKQLLVNPQCENLTSTSQ